MDMAADMAVPSTGETGETGSIKGTTSVKDEMVIAGMWILAVWNSFQVLIFIFRTFKRRHSLYFASMLIANLGIPLRSTAVLFRFFAILPNLLMCPLVSIGFWMMVTGQSVVLYSRLNLIIGNPRTIRWTALVIAFSFFCLEVPTSSFFIASNVDTSLSDGARNPRLVRTFQVLEFVQTAFLMVQEFGISLLYVGEANRALEPMRLIKGDRVRRMMQQLVGLSILTLGLDASLMAVQYTGKFFAIQTMYKGVIYSIKLQAEAWVLYDLTWLVRNQECTCHSTPAENFSSQLTRRAGRLSGPSGHRLSSLQVGETHPSKRESRLVATSAFDDHEGILMEERRANESGIHDGRPTVQCGPVVERKGSHRSIGIT